MIFLTSPGKTYSVNSISGCTVSAGGTTLATIPANVQTTFIAPEEEVLVSDDNAIIVEVTGVGAGGSGGSGEGGSGGVTAEAIQAVVPIKWTGASFHIGSGGSRSNLNSVSFGNNVTVSNFSTAMGQQAWAGADAVVVGTSSYAATASVALGKEVNANKNCTVTVGALFYESVDGTSKKYTCTTAGTGSITIGAGANTLNNGDTESSNSVTIGCKAENKGADSVVLGAQANNVGAGALAIGTGASSEGGISIGTEAKTKDIYDIAIGRKSKASGIGGSTVIGGNASAVYDGVAIGYYSEALGRGGVATGFSAKAPQYGSSAYGLNAKANKTFSTAIGINAISNDAGAVVFVSWDETETTKTQLYFSGANTPLANTYANGEAIMGYVTTDSEGNMVASGFKRLSALFDEGTMTQPATLDENGEWVQPKVFRPSDVDLPIEESTEPEEYQPLPVYPIVEPEIEEIPSES